MDVNALPPESRLRIAELLRSDIATAKAKAESLWSEVRQLRESADSKARAAEATEESVKGMQEYLDSINDGTSEPIHPATEGEAKPPVELHPRPDTQTIVSQLPEGYDSAWLYPRKIHWILKQLGAWVSIGKMTEIVVALDGLPDSERRDKMRSLSSILLKRAKAKRVVDFKTIPWLISGVNYWGLEEWKDQPKESRKTIR